MLGSQSEHLASMGSSQWLSLSCMEKKAQVLFLSGFTALESVEEAEPSGVCLQLALVELRHSRTDIKY